MSAAGVWQLKPEVCSQWTRPEGRHTHNSTLKDANSTKSTNSALNKKTTQPKTHTMPFLTTMTQPISCVVGTHHLHTINVNVPAISTWILTWLGRHLPGQGMSKVKGHTQCGMPTPTHMISTGPTRKPLPTPNLRQQSLHLINAHTDCTLVNGL